MKSYEEPLVLDGWREFARFVRCKVAQHPASCTEVEEWQDGPLRRKRTLKWCMDCGRILHEH